jgi:hypothetical protein
MNRLEKHDPQRLFDALSSEDMLDELLRREAYRHQEDKRRLPFSLGATLGFLLGWLLGGIAVFLSQAHAHAADLSSLQQTPVRLVAVERREPETKPFTPPPCVGIVWPVRMARCEVTWRF